MVQTQPKYKQKTTPFVVSSFTGKERDSETGFSYFGARYYDSDLMTGWLSVDPLADKYPGVSPYAYCAWNPIKLVDPDGRKIRGVKYDRNGQMTGYTKWGIKNGVKDYIDIRSKTESGAKNIERMHNNDVMYTILVVDRPLYTEERKGKFKRLAGFCYKNTIVISTDLKEYDETMRSVVVPLEYFNGEYSNYERLTLNRIDVNSEDVLSLDEININLIQENTSCYGSVPLKERSRDQIINAIGAHEESHMLDNAEEFNALEIECNAVKEYENH